MSIDNFLFLFLVQWEYNFGGPRVSIADYMFHASFTGVTESIVHYGIGMQIGWMLT